MEEVGAVVVVVVGVVDVADSSRFGPVLPDTDRDGAMGGSEGEVMVAAWCLGLGVGVGTSSCAAGGTEETTEWFCCSFCPSSSSASTCAILVGNGTVKLPFRMFVCATMAASFILAPASRRSTSWFAIRSAKFHF